MNKNDMWAFDVLMSAEADGGKGSGNFGHAGRPGQVGGSVTETDAAEPAERVSALQAKIAELDRARKAAGGV